MGQWRIAGGGGRVVSDGGGLRTVDGFFETWDFFFFDMRG